MLKVIAIILLPLFICGWICGIMSRPVWVGFVEGFNFFLLRVAAEIDEELAKLESNIHENLEEGDDPFATTGR